MIRARKGRDGFWNEIDLYAPRGVGSWKCVGEGWKRDESPSGARPQAVALSMRDVTGPRH
jgi:hypothetical protein